MRKLKKFIGESITELKKVVWPSRTEVESSTKVVLVSTCIFAAILGVVDFVIVAALDKFIG